MSTVNSSRSSFSTPQPAPLLSTAVELRKVRWRSATVGKRGGIRVIYYWFVSEDEIYMLLAYGKGEKDDLSARELKILRGLVKDAGL